MKTSFLNESSILKTDIDGTLTSLDIPTPDRQVDPIAREALRQFNLTFPNQVIIMTGRDISQVKQCYGGKMPSYPVISSNGAQLDIPGKESIIHAFSAAELDLLHSIKEDAKKFTKCHPELYVETFKPFEVGYHLKPNLGYEDVPIEDIYFLGEDFQAILDKYIVRSAKLGLMFRIEKTEITHTCFNHGGINKLSGYYEFARHLGLDPSSNDMSNVVYFGDCFQRGNDRDTAIHIKKYGGRLVQVYNNHTANIPDEGDEAEPHQALPSCRALGQVLRKWVNDVTKG